jgi:hypothetical protein
MKIFAKFLCMVLLAAAVTACGRFGPVGENFSPKNDASIVLNKNAGQWRLFVEGVDISKEVGLNSTINEDVGGGWITFEQKGELFKKLPKTFSLQWSGIPVTCVECSAKLKDWTRKTQSD